MEYEEPVNSKPTDRVYLPILHCAKQPAIRNVEQDKQPSTLLVSVLHGTGTG